MLQVDEVFAGRKPSPDGRWLLTFVTWQTAPESDRDVLIVCGHRDPGFHVHGTVGHQTTFWAPSKDGASLMITFESPADIRVFRHIDRGKGVVLEAIAHAK